jgi:hypothetical protein
VALSLFLPRVFSSYLSFLNLTDLDLDLVLLSIEKLRRLGHSSAEEQSMQPQTLDQPTIDGLRRHKSPYCGVANSYTGEQIV